MHPPIEFLQTLAMVLCVAAAATVVFQWLRQPVVFGYLFAGMIVGPYIPVPLEADNDVVQQLAELGVILLMFSIGLEFSLAKLARVGPTAGMVAVAQASIMLSLGYMCGRLFGWSTLECIYAGAIICISSTTIIIKAFAEQRIVGKLVDIVIGVLLMEDLIAIFLLAILTTVSSGQDLTYLTLATTAGRLAAFLAVLLVVGMLTIPRLFRAIVRLNSPETTVVAAVGVSFAFALLAIRFEYSVALGAFLAGTLVAESGQAKVIEHLVQPVRDIFGAVFFVAVGMMIDPAELSQHWQPILVFTAVVIVGNVVVVSISAFLTGYDPRTSIQAGMSLAQIGEFSFIIAGVGVSTGATDKSLYSIAVAVSALTTLTTPWLIRYSDAAAKFVDRKLPRALQTFAALYGSWIEEMRLAPHDQSERAQIRRRVRMLLLDFVVVVSIVIGASVERGRLTEYVMNYTGAERRLSTILWLAGAGLILAPFCVGIIRNARGLGQALALRVLPAALEGRADLGLAPRRALIVTLQLAIVMLLGGPIVAVTQPFLPPFQGAAIFSIVVIALGINFWRSATNLQGHARAGALTIVELLANQARGDETPAAAERGIEQLHQILPGLGDPIPIKLDGTSPAVGKTLKQLNLRSLTSATVLAIQRGDERIVVPSGAEHLQVGDTLAVAGSHEAIAAARALLTGAA